MPSVVALLFLHAVKAASCPQETSVEALRSINDDLLRAVRTPDQTDPDLPARAQLQLGCTMDPPAPVAARTFVLLGAWNFYHGEPGDADRFFRAAFALEGPDAWNRSLDDELQTWFHEVGRPAANKGVVFAPEPLFEVPVDLWGAPGAPPWIMSVGTFTFQAGHRSAPINVNRNTLTLVTPAYVEDFNAGLQGTVDPPPKQLTTTYIAGSHSSTDASTSSGQASSDPSSSDPSSAGSEPTGSAYDFTANDDEDDESALSIRPHLAAGGNTVLASGYDDGARAIPAGSFTLLGAEAGLGLVLTVRDRWTLTPELAASWGTHTPGFLQDDLHTASYGGQSPLEEVADTWMAGSVRLPLGLRRRVLAVAAGPELSLAQATISESMACQDATGSSEETSCYGTSEGSLLLAGAVVRVAAHPRFFPLFPQFDLSARGDGDRLYFAATLSVAWEGEP